MTAAEPLPFLSPNTERGWNREGQPRQFDHYPVAAAVDVQCGARDLHADSGLCNLGEGHPGDHAEVSLSGLVVRTWPRSDRDDCSAQCWAECWAWNSAGCQCEDD